jgi:hypothetical protein
MIRPGRRNGAQPNQETRDEGSEPPLLPTPNSEEAKKLYQLPYVLLFSILAVVTGGNSYRSIETFITVHRRRLNAAFGLRWKRAPAHTAIRYSLQGLDPKGVEQVFRRRATGLLDGTTDPSRHSIALDSLPRRRPGGRWSAEVPAIPETAKQPSRCMREPVLGLDPRDTKLGLILAHVDTDSLPLRRRQGCSMLSTDTPLG